MSSPKASRPGHSSIRSLNRKPFPPAYVEYAHARLQAEMPDDVAGDAAPAAVVAVATVAVFPWPVPIHLAEFSRFGDHRLALPFTALLDVALGLRKRAEKIDFSHSGTSSSPLPGK